MKTGFTLPSCNYNIVLSESDLKQLLEKGYISFDPDRVPGSFKDELGNNCHNVRHALLYINQNSYEDRHVQFVGIALENHEVFKKKEATKQQSWIDKNPLLWKAIQKLTDFNFFYFKFVLCMYLWIVIQIIF